MTSWSALKFTVGGGGGELYPYVTKRCTQSNGNNIKGLLLLLYYLAGCKIFPPLPAPILQLYYLLPPVASVIPVLFH